MADVYLAVEKLWRRVAWVQLRQRFSQNILSKDFQLSPDQMGDVRAAFVQRDNLRFRRSIEDEYLDAIRNARREIFIASAYFLPGRRFRRAPCA